MKPIKDVDDYIATAPEDVQDRLQELRELIMSTVPGAEERISYAMPSYHYIGRLIYFAYWKEHIGIYGISGIVLAEHKKELEGYVMTKGTIQLPLKKPLPVALIKNLIKAQVRENNSTVETI